TTLEAIINEKAFNALPKDLQAIVLNACKVANQEMLAEYTARNPAALKTLVEKHKVDIRIYPDDVLATLRKFSSEVVEELAAKDAFAKKVYNSYMNFLKGSREWGSISDFAYLKARDKG
ncbi:MAG: ABC transporter substrate-binding protein, partial [Candidatus Thiodiazotropha taylori]|nr:ABC transporter substrate-binding protein [Candidatus Thiodiazotropha taylori]